MNFSSLKRKLSEIRGKKKSKSECSVYTLDSPPDLVQKKNVLYKQALDLPNERSAILKNTCCEKGSLQGAKFQVVADVHRHDDLGTISDIGNGDFENKHVKREHAKLNPNDCKNEKNEKKVSPLFCVQNTAAAINKTRSTTQNDSEIITSEGGQNICSARSIILPIEDKSVTEIVAKLNNLKIKDKTINCAINVRENVIELEQLKSKHASVSDKKESQSKNDELIKKQNRPTDKTKSQSETNVELKGSANMNDKAENACQSGLTKAISNSTSGLKTENCPITATKSNDKTDMPCEKTEPSKTPLKSTEKPAASYQGGKHVKISTESAADLQTAFKNDSSLVISKSQEKVDVVDTTCKKGSSPKGTMDPNSSPTSTNWKGSVQPKIPFEAVDFEDLDYDLVGVAFKHAIIPEKLQTADQDLEVMIQKCLYYALTKDSEKSPVTDPVAQISPVLEDIKAREKEGNSKVPPKKSITTVAFEAAHIKHECDKMVYAYNGMTLPSKRSLKNKNIKALTKSLERVQEDCCLLANYFSRLKEYARYQDKLPSLIIYRTPVYDHLHATMYDFIDILTNYKQVVKYIREKIDTMKEARKRSELAKNASETAKNTENATSAAPSIPKDNGPQKLKKESSASSSDNDSTNKKTNQSPNTKKESTSNTDLSQQQSSIAEKQAANTPRKKSWKANRASELRCASSSTPEQTARRIIAPINEKPARVTCTSHDKSGVETTPNNHANSSPVEKAKVLSHECTEETKTESGTIHKLCENENGECRLPGCDESTKSTTGVSHAVTGGGDGLNVSRTLPVSIATSTPKKKGRTSRRNTPNVCPNTVAKGNLLGGGKTHDEVINNTNGLNEEDDEIVSSFCDGGEGCLDEIDVDDISEHDESTANELDNDPEAKEAVLAQNAEVMKSLINKSVQCEKTFNTSLNSTYGSSMTGNNTRDFSDLSRSFTSYIETNNTIDFSSLEVKPTHGDRVNKKKLQAEIKPKKKKTRGVPNQHLEPKPNSKSKNEPNRGVGDDFRKDKNEAKKEYTNVSFVDEILDREDQKSQINQNKQSKIEQKNAKSVSKPMNYEHWQTIDQRELLMVPDQVHYQGESSKLKDVEDMYTVSGAKGKKKKKKKEKKAKIKQKEDGDKHSDDDFFM